MAAAKRAEGENARAKRHTHKMGHTHKKGGPSIIAAAVILIERKQGAWSFEDTASQMRAKEEAGGGQRQGWERPQDRRGRCAWHVGIITGSSRRSARRPGGPPPPQGSESKGGERFKRMCLLFFSGGERGWAPGRGGRFVWAARVPRSKGKQGKAHASGEKRAMGARRGAGGGGSRSPCGYGLTA